MRRAAALAAALALAAAGCDSGGDANENAGESREVTTTRVQVVEGIGKKGGFNA